MRRAGSQAPLLPFPRSRNNFCGGGADVFKALGARAVCLGRPYVYGLALAGSTGASEVIRNLLADCELTMGLAGCRSLAEITRESLLRV
jgi:lactate 2-monooxygenase